MRNSPRSPLNFMFVAVLITCCLPVPGLADSTSRPFKIGFVLPLTGAAADYGVSIKNCVELAKNDQPKNFTNIEFLYEDVAYDTKLAITAFRKLAQSDNVDLVVTWGVSFCKALAPLAESLKKPLVGICLDPTVATDKKYVLRFINTTDELARTQVGHLSAKGMKKLGLLLAEHPFLEETMQALKRNLTEGQTLTIIDQFPNSDMDFRTTILKLAKDTARFDAVGILLFAGQISSFYKQARDLHFTIPTFGTNFFESLSEVNASQGAMDGALFTGFGIRPDFQARYVGKFFDMSQLSFGAPAYEFTVLAGELFNRPNQSRDADDIMFSLVSGGVRNGIASGPFTFVDDKTVGKYFRFPVAVKRVTGSGFETLNQ